MAEPWTFWIESYRRIPGEAGWSAANDDVADMWLVNGQQGEDQRCFGAFPTRADAEKGMEHAKQYKQKQEQKQEQKQAEEPRPEGYHLDYRRNGTEDEIIICAPDGRDMAYIQYWEEFNGERTAGADRAERDANLIINALNAHAAGQGRNEATARTDTANAYHTRPGRDLFDYEDTIDIHAPDGRSMAFILLSDQPNQAKADAQLIVDALNAYQPHLAQEQPEQNGVAPSAKDQQLIPGDRADAGQRQSPGRRNGALDGFLATLAHHRQSGDASISTTPTAARAPGRTSRPAQGELRRLRRRLFRYAGRAFGRGRPRRSGRPAAGGAGNSHSGGTPRPRAQLQNVAQILPDGGRTEPSPILDRMRQWLGKDSGEPHAPSEAQPRQHFPLTGCIDPMLTELEAFGDHFERIARTPEQRELAAAFQNWIADTSRNLFIPLAREAANKANDLATASRSADLSTALFGSGADAPTLSPRDPARQPAARSRRPGEIGLASDTTHAKRGNNGILDSRYAAA